MWRVCVCTSVEMTWCVDWVTDTYTWRAAYCVSVVQLLLLLLLHWCIDAAVSYLVLSKLAVTVCLCYSSAQPLIPAAAAASQHSLCVVCPYCVPLILMCHLSSIYSIALVQLWSVSVCARWMSVQVLDWSSVLIEWHLLQMTCTHAIVQQWSVECIVCSLVSYWSTQL